MHGSGQQTGSGAQHGICCGQHTGAGAQQTGAGSQHVVLAWQKSPASAELKDAAVTTQAMAKAERILFM